MAHQPRVGEKDHQSAEERERQQKKNKRDTGAVTKILLIAIYQCRQTTLVKYPTDEV